ncbi:type I DNA topoisomerase [Parahaliea mediterranea]|uniref:DNA topoisomerase 1 n=1 Tax=Parahaliea mediterranea TaxID=651086 RepID=A0A939ILG6_9GAMM|nr:type I DNA topoisomerase [Parahaliea mediterranea]MBN7798376.1 type I DNA topoisomerase [Parahaliea mediterranea]
MGKSLVIVESPAKAKTINKYLGPDFIVKSSVGHIRDLPTAGSGGKADPKERAAQAARTRKMNPEEKAAYKKQKAREQLIRRMGIDPEHGWKAEYQVLPGKEKVVAELKKLAEKSDAIYLATDLDREGEAIAWHLREAIGGDDDRYQRVVFNEITKKAIAEAFEEPAHLDYNRVNAQQARRFLDRVVGYMVSPLLWAKVARGLSAGRVQSVAVRLIVEREREIRAFVPEEYWEVHADLATGAGEDVRFQVRKHRGENFRPNNEQSTRHATAELEQLPYAVSQREDKPTRSKPPAPYITSTLQQAASTRLGFSVKKTMMLAQRLYEAGYITYMRTDSTNLSDEAVSACRAHIEANFPAKYLPDAPNRYSSKEGAQEAHEAIRPSDVNLKQTALQGMERDAERLYELIWRQFVACQMPPAEYLSSTVTVAAGDYELNAKGRIIVFDGFTRVQPSAGRKGEDRVLPDIKRGDTLDLKALDPAQHFTKPTPRFGEASLVRELEKRGIGRPSTYASIISTIQDRGYVRLENKRFYAEKMGEIVTDRLQKSFTDLLDYGFTSSMEERLDEVAQGDMDWRELLDRFYGEFRELLEKAEEPEAGMQPNEPTMTDIACAKCGRPMQIRTASTGVFLGCSGYALPPKERCKHTVNLVPGDEAISEDADDEAESRLLRSKHRCKLCNAAMDSYLIDEQRKLHVCGNNPDCPGFEVEHGKFKIKGYDGPTLECDKCGAEMQLKTGRFGKYFGCTAEDCKNTRKLLRSGEPAPPKMDPVPMPELACEKVEDTYVLRDGAAGLFLAASQFPRNRETRAPFVDELLPHRSEIDPKYSFLFSAPATDPDGNRSQVRYSRKTKEQYVMTEEAGKATGWKAFYRGGKWQVEEGKAASKAAPKTKKGRKSS